MMIYEIYVISDDITMIACNNTRISLLPMMPRCRHMERHTMPLRYAAYCHAIFAPLFRFRCYMLLPRFDTPCYAIIFAYFRYGAADATPPCLLIATLICATAIRYDVAARTPLFTTRLRHYADASLFSAMPAATLMSAPFIRRYACLRHADMLLVFTPPARKGHMLLPPLCQYCRQPYLHRLY